MSEKTISRYYPFKGYSKLGCPRNEQKKFRLELKQTEDLFRLCFGLFRQSKNKKFLFLSVFQPISTQTKQTELFRNKPKQPEISCKKYQNMLSIKMFWLLFCLFWLNRNTKTL